MHALITGVLYASPEPRTSKAGKSYTAAKLRAESKDGTSQWVSLVAFGATADTLLALPANTPLSVTGKLETRPYLDKQGQPAVGLSLVADEVLALAAKAKGGAPPAAASRPQASHAPAMREFAPAGMDDDLPWGA